jgi:hypothetical protein
MTRWGSDVGSSGLCRVTELGNQVWHTHRWLFAHRAFVAAGGGWLGLTSDRT